MGHHRRERRQRLTLEVRFRRDQHGASLTHSGKTSDLGLGGAFVESEMIPEIGTRLRFSVSTPTTWDPIEIHADVRWVQDGSDGQPAGFGVKFGNLTGAEATALYELINHSAFE